MSFPRACSVTVITMATNVTYWILPDSDIGRCRDDFDLYIQQTGAAHFVEVVNAPVLRGMEDRVFDDDELVDTIHEYAEQYDWKNVMALAKLADKLDGTNFLVIRTPHW